jgi:hypothetical protein
VSAARTRRASLQRPHAGGGRLGFRAAGNRRIRTRPRRAPPGKCAEGIVNANAGGWGRDAGTRPRRTAAAVCHGQHGPAFAAYVARDGLADSETPFSFLLLNARRFLRNIGLFRLALKRNSESAHAERGPSAVPLPTHGISPITAVRLTASDAPAGADARLPAPRLVVFRRGCG